jgi:hypothetical protein
MYISIRVFVEDQPSCRLYQNGGPASSCGLINMMTLPAKPYSYQQPSHPYPDNTNPGSRYLGLNNPGNHYPGFNNPGHYNTGYQNLGNGQNVPNYGYGGSGRIVPESPCQHGGRDCGTMPSRSFIARQMGVPAGNVECRVCYGGTCCYNIAGKKC